MAGSGMPQAMATEGEARSVRQSTLRQRWGMQAGSGSNQAIGTRNEGLPVRSGMTQSQALGIDGREARESAIRRRTTVGRPPRSSDRISNLPEHLAHHIMSFLPTKDVVRTVSWSKRWQSIWWSYPIHDFDETRYRNRDPNFDRDDLMEAMMDGLLRENGQTATVQKLRVKAIHNIDTLLQEYTERYIEQGINESKLLEIDLIFDSEYCYSHAEDFPSSFLFPNMVFKSATYLTTLKLQCCEIKFPSDEASFSLPSLKIMFLKFIETKDVTLQSLISNCPVLDKLTLDYLFDFKEYKIINPSVTAISIASSVGLVVLELDVPEICFFSYNGAYEMINHPALEIEHQCGEIEQVRFRKRSRGFQKLKTVVMTNVTMSDEVGANCFSYFENLETASFLCCAFDTFPLGTNSKLERVTIDCCEYNNLDINNQSLHTFSLSSSAHVPNPILNDVQGSRFSGVKSVTLSGTVFFPNGRFFFESGPHLETLVLSSCSRLNHIQIMSHSLKNVSIEYCRFLQSASIHAGSLQRFKYSGGLINFLQVDIPGGVAVELHLLDWRHAYSVNVENYECALWNFLAIFRVAKSLKIQGDHPMAILVPSRSNLGPPIRFLDELYVRANLDGISYKDYVRDIFSFAFCYKTVILEIFTREKRNQHKETICSIMTFNFEVAENAGYLLRYAMEDETRTYKHDCVHHHLLKARIQNFGGTLNEMEVVTYLLKGGMRLKNLNVRFKPDMPTRSARAIANKIRSIQPLNIKDSTLGFS